MRRCDSLRHLFPNYLAFTQNGKPNCLSIGKSSYQPLYPHTFIFNPAGQTNANAFGLASSDNDTDTTKEGTMVPGLGTGSTLGLVAGLSAGLAFLTTISVGLLIRYISRTRKRSEMMDAKFGGTIDPFGFSRSNSFGSVGSKLSLVTNYGDNDSMKSLPPPLIASVLPAP